MGPDQRNRDAYLRVIEAVGQGNAGILTDLIHEDMVDHNPIPGQAPGLKGFKQWMISTRSSFPDFRGAVEDVLAEGDRVAARMRWRGTQKGEFLGLPPTGKAVVIPAFHIARFADGRVAEWWGVADLLDAATQLGATIALREGGPAR
jgi:steroid delta-isomerase-like uncharacterized protein